MTTCRHCRAPIRRRMSWPSGREQWYASVPNALVEWPFCEAVNGRPHMPL